MIPVIKIYLSLHQAYQIFRHFGLREALSNKPVQRRLDFNLLAENGFRPDQASFVQISPLFGCNLAQSWATLPLAGTRLPYSGLA